MIAIELYKIVVEIRNTLNEIIYTLVNNALHYKALLLNTRSW